MKKLHISTLASFTADKANHIQYTKLFKAIYFWPFQQEAGELRPKRLLKAMAGVFSNAPIWPYFYAS